MEEERDPFDAVVDAAEARVSLRRRATRDFVKGPIDWQWVLAASRVDGSTTLLVGLAVWRLSGLHKNGTLVWETRLTRELGVHRRTVARSLRALEAAGLVSLDRRSGRHPRITIILPEIRNERR